MIENTMAGNSTDRIKLGILLTAVPAGLVIYKFILAYFPRQTFMNNQIKTVQETEAATEIPNIEEKHSSGLSLVDLQATESGVIILGKVEDATEAVYGTWGLVDDAVIIPEIKSDTPDIQDVALMHEFMIVPDTDGNIRLPIKVSSTQGTVHIRMEQGVSVLTVGYSIERGDIIYERRYLGVSME